MTGNLLNMGGNCCESSGPCCLTLEELPTVTVGDTVLNPGPFSEAGGLMVDGCCYKYNFIDYGDLPWVENKSALIAFDQRAGTISQDNYLMDTAVWDAPFPAPFIGYIDGRAYVSNGTTQVVVPVCPMTSEYLCHTIDYSIQQHIVRNMYTLYRRRGVDVYIFRMMAQTAEDEEPVCRWFIVSSLIYDVRSSIVDNFSETISTSATSSGCCQVAPSQLTNSSQAFISDSEIYRLMKEEWYDVWGDYNLTTTLQFFSAKTYLTLPTGSITFNAGEVLDDVDFGMNPFGGPNIPCIGVNYGQTTSTINSYDSGRFPFSWIVPTITTTSSIPNCITTVRLPGSYGSNRCRVAIIDGALAGFAPSYTDYLSISYKISGGGPLIPQGWNVDLINATPCNDSWCGPGEGGWTKKRQTSVRLRNLTTSRTFQNYTPQSLSIPGGSWTISI